MVPSNGGRLPLSQPPKLFRDAYRSIYEGLFQRGYMTLDSTLWNLSRVIGGYYYSPNVGEVVNVNNPWVLLYWWWTSRSIHDLASLERGYYDILGVGRNANSSEMNQAYYGASSMDTYELFEEWCKKHGRTYSSEEEKSYRFKVFQETYASVTRHNQMGNSSYTAGLNHFAALRFDEIPKGYRRLWENM